MDANNPPTVMVVDDDRELLALYREYLEQDYPVRTATDGADALSRMDESVDIVLLDRRMPRMTGDEFLHELRDRGFEVPVTMVTAVDPEVDIVDMGFDDYLVKPVTRDELIDLVQTMERRMAYDTVVRRHFSLASKVAVLNAEHAPEELEHHDEYHTLTDQLAASREEARTRLAAMTEDEMDALFRDLS